MKRIICLMLALLLIGACTFVGCEKKNDKKNDRDDKKNETSEYVTDPSSPAKTEPTETEPTEPESTEPESTEPESTEPESTEPEPTEPVEQTLAEKYDVDLMRDGKLIVGIEAAYEPFEMIADDGAFMGYDVDLTYAIAEKLGVEVMFINTGFDGILEGIDVNYDCVISAITINEDRKENYLFTDPYLENYQCVLVKDDLEEDIDGFEDLDGGIIAVQEGTTADSLMEGLIEDGTIDANVFSNPHIGPCLDAMKNGEVDYIVCDSTFASAYVDEHDGFRISWVDYSLREAFAIAVDKDNTALAAAMNEAMTELRAEGFFEENYARWFG